MLSYLLKRLLFFIPTLLIISIGAFFLSKMAPGDPVEMLLKGESENGSSDFSNYEKTKLLYGQIAERLHLDKPLFYFSLLPEAYPANLYKTIDPAEKKTIKNLIAQYGNHREIMAYHQQLTATLITALKAAEVKNDKHLTTITNTLKELLLIYHPEKIRHLLNALPDEINPASSKREDLAKNIKQLKVDFAAITAGATPYKNYLPGFKWYGTDNQYHLWISSFFKGDFGISYADGRPVHKKIWSALFWTLLLNIIAIVFVFGISIPLGVFLAAKKGARTERIISIILFILYSLPVFWIATMLLVFFTTPEYGMDIFKGIGLSNLPDDLGFWEKTGEISQYLILPVFSLTYGALAYITMQMKGGMIKVLQENYIRTARAKGLDEKTVVWKHAFRNALFPIITLLASLFPGIIAGSVVVEMIFNIPGMGRLTLESIVSHDWPVVYTILMFGAILTMIGILVSDVLYSLADPRITYQKR